MSFYKSKIAGEHQTTVILIVVQHEEESFPKYIIPKPDVRLKFTPDNSLCVQVNVGSTIYNINKKILATQKLLNN